MDRPTVVTTTLDGSPCSIDQIIAVQMERNFDAPALLFSGGAPITYRSLHKQMQEITAKLRGAGVSPTDRVAIVLPNGVGMAIAFLGTAVAAACAPLNPDYTSEEFDFYLRDLGARAVIVQANTESPVRNVAQTRGIAVLELDSADGVFTLATPARESVPLELPEPVAVALVLHTSGTTSRPKMIRLTHANLCASAANIGSTLQLGQQDRCLNVMPLFHIHGLVGALLASLNSGGSVVCTQGFSPVQFFRWLDEFRPTWYTAVPTMHQEVLARVDANRDTIARSHLRFIRSSSAKLPVEVMTGIERAFGVPLVEAYGMTEASHQIASNPLPPHPRKPNSVGLPTGCEVAILDAAAHGDPGEIGIRGPNVATALPYDISTAVGEASWFRTGDLGYFDQDGYLFISGRLKEIINRGGEKIAPAEIDNVLREHPAVRQAVACAVPDQRLGEDVIAVVVLRPGDIVTERELREFASMRLAPFKVPRRIMFVDDIPKGPTGKLQRIGLAKKLGIESMAFAQPSSATFFEAPSTATESAIAEIWREVLQIEQVSRRDNFFELGGDSLAATIVITEGEARLGVRLNLRDLGFGTLQQVAAACDEEAAVKQSPEPGGALRRQPAPVKAVWQMANILSPKKAIGETFRTCTSPFVRLRAIEQCPGWLATLHDLKVPANIEPNKFEPTAGSSNIRIIFQLLDQVLPLSGDVAECGVWQGSTLIPTGLYVRRRAPGKRVLGFDSFQGLDDAVSRDVALGGEDDARKRVGGFSNTSYERVLRRVQQFGLAPTVTLVKGYFKDTLAQYTDSRFCFVHLDCVIYESYKQCLEYFYQRMVQGAIILLDEYKDPPWPGCTQAVDEFMASKPERLSEIKSDNYVKFFIRKL
jgi:oxalate---CoA ligase